MEFFQIFLSVGSHINSAFHFWKGFENCQLVVIIYGVQLLKVDIRKHVTKTGRSAPTQVMAPTLTLRPL